MIMSSTTDIYAGLAAVSNDAFNGIGIYVVLVAGIVLGFFILERLAVAIFPDKYGANK